MSYVKATNVIELVNFGKSKPFLNILYLFSSGGNSMLVPFILSDISIETESGHLSVSPGSKI